MHRRCSVERQGVALSPAVATPMSGFDRHQALAALIALVTALFVAAGAMPTWRWRRQLRAGAIIGFAIALFVVLAEIALWLAGFAR
jgi:hypothetical protein